MIALAVSALALAGVIALFALGLRAGDHPGEAVLLDVAPLTSPRGAAVTVCNPGRVPVIVGISLRRAGARLRLEGRAYVRVRSGSTAAELLAARQTSVGLLDAGETQTFVVPGDASIRRRAELVAVIGQRDRLRTLHRLVVLAEAPRVRQAPACGERNRGHEQDGRPGADRERDHVRERERHQALER